MLWLRQAGPPGSSATRASRGPRRLIIPSLNDGLSLSAACLVFGGARKPWSRPRHVARPWSQPPWSPSLALVSRPRIAASDRCCRRALSHVLRLLFTFRAPPSEPEVDGGSRDVLVERRRGGETGHVNRCAQRSEGRRSTRLGPPGRGRGTPPLQSSVGRTSTPGRRRLSNGFGWTIRHRARTGT
jgi:hypothetical protein